MPSLLSMPVRAALIQRVERVRPDATRLWGTLDAHRMLCHLAESLRVTFGEVRLNVSDGWMNRWYGRLFVIDAPFAWPRGKIQGPPEVLPTASEHEFLWDRNRVVEYLFRFHTGTHQNWGVHPLLGKLSPQQWARFTWRHCDHHLRQFDA